MSVLLEKAKKLMSETGCTLSEAAKALKDASEDYDLAMELVKENGHFDAKEPVKEVAPILASEEPASETAEEPVPETIEEPASEVEEEPISESVEESTEEYAQELTPEYEQDPNAYYEQDPNGYYDEYQNYYYDEYSNYDYEGNADSAPIEEIKETTEAPRKVEPQKQEPKTKETKKREIKKSGPQFKMPKSLVALKVMVAIEVWLLANLPIGFIPMLPYLGYFDLDFEFSVVLSVVLSALLLILCLFFGLKKSKHLPKLQQIKEAVPNVPDVSIYKAFLKCHKNVERTISYLRGSGAIEMQEFEIQKEAQKHLIAPMIFSLFSAVAWCVAVYLYDPTKNTEFEETQFIGIAAAALFLIIAFVLAGVAKGKGAKGAILGTFFLMVVSFCVPFALCYDKYLVFLEKLLTYILAGFVILVIFSMLLGKSKSGSNAPRKKSWFDTRKEPEYQEPVEEKCDYEESKEDKRNLRNTVFVNARGHDSGWVDSDGKMYDSDGHSAGWIESDGKMYDDHGHSAGWIASDGKIYDANGHSAGWIDSDGKVYDVNGHCTGYHR